MEDSRPERLRRAIEDAAAAYEELWPTWREDQAICVARAALRRLQGALASGEASWDSPVMELPFEVDWNWEQMGHDSGEVSLGDLDCPSQLAAALTEILESEAVFRSLASLSGGVIHVVEGEQTTVIHTDDIRADLEKTNPDDADRVLAERSRPLSFGVLDVDDDAPPEQIIEALAATPNPPPIRFEGTLSGEPVSGGIVLSFEPLHLCPETREAWFPIVVGLLFDPSSEDDGEPVFPDPATWPHDKVQALWDAVRAPLEALVRPQRGRRARGPYVPDAFPEGRGRVPSNPFVIGLFRAILAAGPARDRSGWRLSGETGEPVFTYRGRRDTRIVFRLARAADMSADWSEIAKLGVFDADVAVAVLAQIVEAFNAGREMQRDGVLVTGDAIVRHLQTRQSGLDRDEAAPRASRACAGPAT